MPWHLPGGPVCPLSGWAATSNVKVGETTFPVNREWVVMKGKNGARDKVTMRRSGEEGVEQGRGPGAPIAKE